MHIYLNMELTKFLKSAKISIPKGFSEDELLQRLALATTRIERVVGIPGR